MPIGLGRKVERVAKPPFWRYRRGAVDAQSDASPFHRLMKDEKDP